MNTFVPNYPADTVEVRSLRSGRPVILRPLGRGDAALLQDFVRRLSPASRLMRFQSGFNELDPGLLANLTEVDHRERVAFAAVVYEQGREVMIGEVRYAPSFDDVDASEFAVAVADAWQHMGLGATLMDKLLRHARACGVERIHGDVLRENAGMLRLAGKLGFAFRAHPDGAWLTRVSMDLERASQGIRIEAPEVRPASRPAWAFADFGVEPATGRKAAHRNAEMDHAPGFDHAGSTGRIGMLPTLTRQRAQRRTRGGLDRSHAWLTGRSRGG